MLRVVKPKTKRGLRELEKRAPKLTENGKKVLLLHGTTTSVIIKGVLSDLYSLRKAGENAIKYTKKNANIRPFESGGESYLEYLSRRTDCSLFVFGSHSKKRPHNLVIGRMYDHHVYDLIEVGVEQFEPMVTFGGAKKYSPQEGSKPCLVFIGEGFEQDDQLKHLKEILIDVLRGEVVEAINLAGLDKVFLCVAVGKKVYFKHCAIRLKKSGTKVPRIELIEAGPSMDLIIRRNRLPNEELRKEAMKTAWKSSKHKVKNVSRDSLAGKVGRIYMPRQEVNGMALAKMKGLKRRRQEASSDPGASKKARDNHNEEV
ncbi:hypothetical protein GOP47_0024534 [Adiantum capillus-veneris]|uniref:Ribosome production factor 2 homolog n=2 Tax=Adiantum capillus-veneris TaxID=13818 RepID=A0A9D4Z3R9_ADICA|nr:hypothetical protein GOP47_0024534 [Adiantum capillus-veneris]